MSRLSSGLKLLYPGLHIKRYVTISFLGLLIFILGTGIINQTHGKDGRPLTIRVADWAISITHASLRPGILGVILVCAGFIICIAGMGKLITSLTSVLDPDMSPGSLVDAIYQRRKLAQGKRIVVVGGGTGLSTMLRGLKRHSSNITAIVTVTDDGGSSGKLRKQLNILPPGDIRNCLVALADAEPLMTQLFQYRFRNSVKAPVAQPVGAAHGRGGVQTLEPPAEGYGEGLRDHAFGNLLIAAMVAICDGDFEAGVKETSRVLNIRGQVVPSTDTYVRLGAEMDDGSILEGETAIADSPLAIKRVHLIPPNATPLPEAIEALEKADVIVLGPGSVYTSIIPNLLLRGIPEAIRRSKAKKVYVCNVMTQAGETDGFSAYDHVKAIEAHAGTRVFDYVLVNTGQPSAEMMEKYRKSGAVLVEPDVDRIKSAGYRALPGNYISQSDVVRHDASLLAEAIMKLIR